MADSGPDRGAMRTFLSKSPVRRRASRVLVVLVVAVALASPASSEAAQPTVVDTHTPFSIVTVNPCTGEAFAASGFFHLKFTLKPAPNFHLSVEENVESVHGITTSGVRYVVPQQGAFHLIIDSDFAPVNGTIEEMLQFIRQAEDGTIVMGDDFYVRMKTHVTVNANGDMTVFFDDLMTTCR